VNTGALDINTAHTFTAPTTFITNATHDITLDGQLTSSSASSSALVLASGRNFVNNDVSDGASAINMTGGGNWRVYSTAAGSDMNGASQLNPTTTVNGESYPTTTGASG